MTEICENCGAELKKDAKFCQECGQKIQTPEKDGEKIFCINCGAEVTSSENFCENCGTDINSPKIKTEEKSFIEKYKFPIIIAIIAVILLLAGSIIVSIINEQSEPVELPPTKVTVGAEFFEIPGMFALNAGPLDIDTQDGVSSFSQTFTHDYDSISIAVMSSMYDVDLESVAASEGGVRKTLMGYDGYYKEVDVSDYSFTFVLDNKLCVIETTSPYLFDEIKVL